MARGPAGRLRCRGRARGPIDAAEARTKQIAALSTTPAVEAHYNSSGQAAVAEARARARQEGCRQEGCRQEAANSQPDVTLRYGQLLDVWGQVCRLRGPLSPRVVPVPALTLDQP